MGTFVNRSDIGMKIKAIRQHARLSQEKLAELVGVTPQQIQKYEAGKTKISTDKIQVIAHALGVRSSTFFHDRGDALTLNKTEETFIRKLRKVGDHRIHGSLMVILEMLSR